RRGTCAPGRRCLPGAWAVRRGATALGAAGDRRVRVTMGPGTDGVVVESFAEGRADRLDLGSADTPLPGGDAGAVQAAIRQRREPGGALRVIVDSRAFLIGERKLGLGRSAATLVAASAALAPAASQAELLERGLEANSLFHAGQGSGGDVGAAVYGGLIEARRESATLAVRTRALPVGLHLVAGWTGTSAHTTPLLVRFATAPAPAALAELVSVATAAAEAVARGDAATLLDAVDRSAALLVRLGNELDL